MKTITASIAVLLIMIAIMLPAAKSSAQVPEQNLPVYLQDRGTGIPLSQLGTYVRKGELLIYPFYEYYYDKNFEYEPADFGYGSTSGFGVTSKATDFAPEVGIMFSLWP